MSQLAWETRRESYRRRVDMLTARDGYHWSGGELNILLERLMLIVGDDVIGRDLEVLVRLFNRELIGAKRRAKLETKK